MKVYVASVFKTLEDVRWRIKTLLEENGCTAVMGESPLPEGGPSVPWMDERIRESDFVIVVLSLWRAGTLSEEFGIPWTEFEVHRAIYHNKLILIYLLDDGNSGTDKRVQNLAMYLGDTLVGQTLTSGKIQITNELFSQIQKDIRVLKRRHKRFNDYQRRYSKILLSDTPTIKAQIQRLFHYSHRSFSPHLRTLSKPEMLTVIEEMEKENIRANFFNVISLGFPLLSYLRQFLQSQKRQDLRIACRLLEPWLGAVTWLEYDGTFGQHNVSKVLLNTYDRIGDLDTFYNMANTVGSYYYSQSGQCQNEVVKQRYLERADAWNEFSLNLSKRPVGLSEWFYSLRGAILRKKGDYYKSVEAYIERLKYVNKKSDLSFAVALGDFGNTQLYIARDENYGYEKICQTIDFFRNKFYHPPFLVSYLRSQAKYLLSRGRLEEAKEVYKEIKTLCDKFGLIGQWVKACVDIQSAPEFVQGRNIDELIL